MNPNATSGASTILVAADKVPPNGRPDQDCQQCRGDLDHNFDEILMLSNGGPASRIGQSDAEPWPVDVPARRRRK
jgi:hypothetical protein